jgi:uncharacterized protein YkwD
LGICLSAGAAVLVFAFATLSGHTAPERAVGSAPPYPRPSDTLGNELALLDYASAVERQQTLDAIAEIDALAPLAALANRPQPVAPEPGVTERAISQPPPAAARMWTDASFASAVLDAINARRTRAGLQPLAQDAGITIAASGYAAALLEGGALTHTGGGTTVDARLRAAGFYDNVAIGEVLASGTATPSPESIVALWMGSAQHQELVMSAAFRLAGAGCAFDGVQVHCVVDLAG